MWFFHEMRNNDLYKITTYRQYFLQVEFRHGQAPTTPPPYMVTQS
ncbi:hypothetical protein [Moraxella osloensis]|nr:hypothetical protein [Moraxella osloensis]